MNKPEFQDDPTIPEPERFRSPEYLDVLDSNTHAHACLFAPDAIESMSEWANAGYPHEICGLLIGKLTATGWQIEDVTQVENLNKERASDRFQLDPAGYQAVDKSLRGSGKEIIGVFHSHPDCPAKPSPTDLANAWDGFLYPIISVCEGKTRSILAWTINDQGDRFQAVELQS